MHDLYPIQQELTGHFGGQTFVGEEDLNPPENKAVDRIREKELYYQKINLIISVLSFLVFIYLSFFYNKSKKRN